MSLRHSLIRCPARGFVWPIINQLQFSKLLRPMRRPRAGRLPREKITVPPDAVLATEVHADFVSGSRRILTARPGTDGKFAVGRGPTTLPPGRYFSPVTDSIGQIDVGSRTRLAATSATRDSGGQAGSMPT
jgi:hypothetical protein